MAIFLDVSPDPVPVSGVGGLLLIAFVAAMFSCALVVGFVFLIKRIRRDGVASQVKQTVTSTANPPLDKP